MFVRCAQEAAVAQMADPDSEDQKRDLGLRLRDSIERFESAHPTLIQAINDVSYYLSGSGL